MSPGLPAPGLFRSRGAGVPLHSLRSPKPPALHRRALFPVPALLLVLLALHPAALRAQQNDVPLNRDIYYDLDRNHTCLTSTVHTGLRPYIESRSDLTDVMGYQKDTSKYYYQITELLFKKHLFEVKEGDLRAYLDPVFQFDWGYDFAANYTDSAYGATNHNGRGIRIGADFGSKVSFHTTFYENQADLPIYLYVKSNETGAVPGQGRLKTFKRTDMDFSWAMGNVSYTPVRWLNLQFGNGRHFVGDGYRSMLLSDNTSPYPYFKATVLAPSGRWQYATINAKLETFDRLSAGASSENLFYWKRASWHHFSANLGRVQVGLFESTLWNTIDSTGVKSFEAWQVNPVPLLNTFVGATKDVDGMMLGLHGKVKLTDKAYTYGQFAFDPNNTARSGWQVGVQWFDLLRKDVHLLVEYNSANAFLYTMNDRRMNHIHMGQGLAHPLGAYFGELVCIADVRVHRRWWFRTKLNNAQVQEDGSEDVAYGGDILKAGVEIDDGSGPVQRRKTYFDLSASYLMNPKTNMRITVGWSYRDVTPYPTYLQSSHLYVGYRTGLFNRYYDL